MTGAGELQIGAVLPITPDEISEADAARAGYGSLQALLGELSTRSEGEIYRIELGPLRPDPRIALRERPARDEAEFEELRKRLQRLDARSGGSSWTLRTLEILNSHPGVRAGDLCRMLGQEKEPFKLNVRKLKSLGLTESLEVGYRLSPRGAATLEGLRGKRADDRRT